MLSLIINKAHKIYFALKRVQSVEKIFINKKFVYLEWTIIMLSRYSQTCGDQTVQWKIHLQDPSFW